MWYPTFRRFLPRQSDNFNPILPAALIFILSMASISVDRSASAQGECRVDCNATVTASATINSPVSFTASTTVSGCASSPAYEWDFGDGTSTALQQNTNHTYTAPGTYTWKMTVTSSIGATTISTIAGGYGENAAARQAPFTTPAAIARDPQNRGLYVADDLSGNTLLRFINTSGVAATIAGKTIEPGKVRVLAGEGGVPIYQDVWDVPATDYVYTIRGLASGANGDLIYLSDEGNTRIWVYNVSNRDQMVAGRTLKAGNVGTMALLNAGVLNGLSVHPSTGEVYFISDNKVFKIGPTREATAVAGNGATTTPGEKFPAMPVDGTAAPLLTPRALAFDSAGNLFIADTGHARVVKLDAAGKLSLVLQMSLMPINPYPSGIVVFGNNVYVANGNDQTIVQVTGTGAIVAGTEKTACDYTVSSCGDGGPVANARFNMQSGTGLPPLAGIDADANGLYVLDQGDLGKGRVRYLNLSATAVSLAGTQVGPNNINTIAGSGLPSPYDGGPATSGALSSPVGVAADANGNLFIADTGTGRLRFVNRGSNVLTLFPNTPAQQVVEPGQIVTLNKEVGVGATDGVPVTQAGFETLQGLFVTNQGIFVADSKGGPAVDLKRTGVIRFINTSPSAVTVFPSSPNAISVPPGNIARIAGGGFSASNTGDGGFALDAKFLAPSDIAINPTTGDIFISDVGNKAVRRINSATGVVSSLNLPASQYTGLALDAGRRLYIADYDQNRVLRETSAGSGSFAPLNSTPLNKPRDVTVDAGGNAYAINSGENRIVRISSSGAVENFAGTTIGFDGDGGPAAGARLSVAPDGIRINAISTGGTQLLPTTVNIIVGAGGEVVFTDTRNNRVRRIGAGSVSCIKTGSIAISGENPAPTLTRISPVYAVLGGREFTLTVNGTGFVTASKVRWNGGDRPTNYVSSTVLTATIPAADIGQQGTANVTVFNPSPGGGTSNSLSIAITRPNPQPTLSTLAPNKAATGTGFGITVNGSEFVDTSVVRWNGSNRTTVFVNANQLRADIPASDVASVGNAEVTVFNPEPGGGLTGKLNFEIIATNPVPAISQLVPQTIIAGGLPFQLQVSGSRFAATSAVRWNGENRKTTFISESLLTADISSTDIANAGMANIVVFSPTPGGGLSNTFTLPVGKQTATVPATSYNGTVIATESIASLFGADLATGIEVATTIPLPTSLRGTNVTIRDSAGRETLAPLFFVSPAQINFLVPPGAAAGQAIIIVKSADRVAGVGQIQITSIIPGLFTANANGQGVAAAVALRVAANGAQTFEPVATFDAALQRFVPAAIDLGPSGEQIYLILYGSGLRNHGGLSNVTVKAGMADVPVLFAGAAPGFTGLDQVNAGPLPRSLAGRGVVDIVVVAGGLSANTVNATVK
jgi:uncharacterized protein (TIGR03437 family)